MSWEDLMNLAFFVVGLILFAYGANYYNASVGWVGVALMATGFFGEITFKVYVNFIKKKVS